MIAEAAGEDSQIEDLLDEQKKQVRKIRVKGLRWIPHKEDGQRPLRYLSNKEREEELYI
jgi:hypothetical protein